MAKEYTLLEILEAFKALFGNKVTLDDIKEFPSLVSRVENLIGREDTSIDDYFKAHPYFGTYYADVVIACRKCLLIYGALDKDHILEFLAEPAKSVYANWCDPADAEAVYADYCTCVDNMVGRATADEVSLTTEHYADQICEWGEQNSGVNLDYIRESFGLPYDALTDSKLTLAQGKLLKQYIYSLKQIVKGIVEEEK